MISIPNDIGTTFVFCVFRDTVDQHIRLLGIQNSLEGHLRPLFVVVVFAPNLRVFVVHGKGDVVAKPVAVSKVVDDGYQMGNHVGNHILVFLLLLKLVSKLWSEKFL